MSVKRYDKNYKIEVVRRAISKDKAVPDLAKELGIHESSIYKWMGEFQRDEANAFPGSGKLKPEDENYAASKEKMKI